MKHHRQLKVQKLQNKNRMVGKTFNVLEQDERRRTPWLSGDHTSSPERWAKYQQRLRDWDAETERLLRENPNLKLID